MIQQPEIDASDGNGPARTIHQLEAEVEALRAEVQALRASERTYRKAAKALAHQCAMARTEAERERATLLEDHDAFIVELTHEHDRLIAQLARERDEARERASEAVSTRNDVAAASKRIARERTRARIELGEIALERDIARRDAARADRQLAESRKELVRLRRQLEAAEELQAAMAERRPSRIPMPPGKTRSSAPPPPLGPEEDTLSHALVSGGRPDRW